MAGRQRKKAVAFDFEARIEGKPYLRVRNITQNVVVIPDNPASTRTDLYLPPWVEVCVDGQVWKDNRNLRAMHHKGRIELEWVEKTYAPQRFPLVTSAPTQFLPDSAFDQTHAMQVCISGDMERALALIQQDVEEVSTGETAVNFYKTRMYKILKTVEWLEPQLQNRHPVLNAIKERLAWIRSL